MSSLEFSTTRTDVCLFYVLSPSGHILELTWDVPETSGPGVSDPNCISYAYYSNVDFIKVHIHSHTGPFSSVVCHRMGFN